jgi:hypothetical protein
MPSLGFDDAPSPFREYNTRCIIPGCLRWFKGQAGLNQHVRRSHPVVRNYPLVLMLADLPLVEICDCRGPNFDCHWCKSAVVRPINHRFTGNLIILSCSDGSTGTVDNSDQDLSDAEDIWFESIHATATWAKVRDYVHKSDLELDSDSNSDADPDVLEAAFDEELDSDVTNFGSGWGQDLISTPTCSPEPVTYAGASPVSPTLDGGQEYISFGDIMVSLLCLYSNDCHSAHRVSEPSIGCI